MRLWHYKLIPVLPNAMLVSQWRECIAIKRQWEKGTLKHRLVSYVKNYDVLYFISYVTKVVGEMQGRGIKYKKQYYFEIFYWGLPITQLGDTSYFKEKYKEHNDRYLKQCYYNLQEKADRGIITQNEWNKIENYIGEFNE